MFRAQCILTTGFLLLLWAGVNAQSFHFEKITEQDGLSDNRITCFTKDRTGFIWIGTANGLNRYDGNEFRIYRPGQKQFNISHEFINDIEEDGQGQLWVATWNGLNVINLKNDSVAVFSPDAEAFRQKKTKLNNSLIWDVYADRANRIWIAPDSRDLCYYDIGKAEFIYPPWRDFIKSILPARLSSTYTAIQKIQPKSNHELWLGTTLGLFSYNISTQTFFYHGGDDPSDFVSLLYDSINHRVYFGQENLYVYSEETKTLEKITTLRTRQYVLTPHTPILISTHDGLWGVHPGAQQASRVNVDDKSPFALHHEVTHTVFYDRGTLWIGTADGVRIFDRHLDRFHFTRLFPDTIQTLSGNVYHVLDHESHNNYLVSSFNHSKLIVINKISGDRKDITAIAGKSLTKCIRTYVDRNNQLWLLTTNQIFFSTADEKSFRSFPFPEKVDDYLFMDMIQDADGNYWFASMRYGVFHYNTKDKVWRLLKHHPDGLFASRPTSLLSDTVHREVWIGDYSFGAFQYSLDTKKFKYHGMDTSDPDQLHSSLINDVALDQNGDVWVASTSGGVSQYVRSEKKFKTYSMATGLPENTIESIESDGNGNVWLASHQGLTCMSTSGKILKHYTKNSGLSFTGFSTPLSVNSKGEILSGIANGFLRFHPDSLAITTEEFPIVISSMLQGDHFVDTTTVRHFSYDKNEFTFHFSALVYTLPQQVNYFYKLKGYDQGWVNAGNSHTARYTNLSEGSYLFQVKAIDYTGRSSTGVASISFTISPPFWKRWWFIAISLAAFSFLLYWWIRSLQQRILSQQTLNHFATSLYNKNTIEEVFWDIAQNCIKLLHFEDCVVYLLQPDRNILIQKAAAGPKGLTGYKIANPIEIPLGAGIVGTVAETAKAEIISDTSKDSRYIIDDQRRHSEITVPIIVDGKVFGIIDSEHTRKRFFTRWHLKMLEEVAAICSAKISRYFVEENIRSKVARDLHDDMGSTLSSIKIMSNIALEKKEPELSQTYLRSIRQNAASMQESMSDIVWAINPENDTIEKVMIKMKEFAAEILEPMNIQYEFHDQGDFNISRMDLNTRKDFYLIFKEAINNAAKYSQCSRIKIELIRSKSSIELIIHDNGKGFDPLVRHAGNGLKNMHYRANNIGASFTLESQPESGTRIHVNIQSHDQGM